MPIASPPVRRATLPARLYHSLTSNELRSMIEEVDDELQERERERKQLVSELARRGESNLIFEEERRRITPLSIVHGSWLTPPEPHAVISPHDITVLLDGTDITPDHITFVDLDAGYVIRGFHDDTYKTYGSIEIKRRGPEYAGPNHIEYHDADRPSD